MTAIHGSIRPLTRATHHERLVSFIYYLLHAVRPESPAQAGISKGHWCVIEIEIVNVVEALRVILGNGGV
jgi:hypothetical protein